MGVVIVTSHGSSRVFRSKNCFEPKFLVQTFKDILILVGNNYLCSPLHFNPQEQVFGCSSKFQSSADNSAIVIFFRILSTL